MWPVNYFPLVEAIFGNLIIFFIYLVISVEITGIYSLLGER